MTRVHDGEEARRLLEAYVLQRFGAKYVVTKVFSTRGEREQPVWCASVKYPDRVNMEPASFFVEIDIETGEIEVPPIV